MGLYCGIIAGLVPSYIISAAPTPLVGIVGTFSYLSMVFGMALAYHIGQLMDNTNMVSSTAARIVIVFPTICIFVNLVIVCMFPFDSINNIVISR